jgi:hypothetical protein
MAKTVRRKVKVKPLLAVAAGAAAVVFGACGPFTSGNLVAPPPCGADAGPPGCYNENPVDAGSDGGTDGGLGGDQ